MSAKFTKNNPAEETWLISACLLGSNCRYNGKILQDPPQNLLPILGNVTLVPICPEMAGGLPTPRAAAQIEGPSGEAVLDGAAKVTTSEGDDVTTAYLQGANFALEAAKDFRATKACLKARSPSCGFGQTHTKNGIAPQNGVTAAALNRAGLTIYTEEALAGGIDDST